MRRSYIGSSLSQYKESRPSSYVKRKRTPKNYRKSPKNKINKGEKLNQIKAETNNKERLRKDTDYNSQEDIYLDQLSQNFELFLCYKDLKDFIQKKTKVKFFERWQHQFTSSVLRQIKKIKNFRYSSSNYSFDNTNKHQDVKTSPVVDTRNQLFIENNTNDYIYTDQNIYRNQNIYSDRNIYTDQNYYTNQDIYANQSINTGQNVYTGQKIYTDQNIYSDQNAYTDQNIYSNRNAYTDQIIYSNQNAYIDQKIYEDQNIYPDQNSYNNLIQSQKHCSNIKNPSNFESSQNPILNGTSNPEVLANSVISPSSSVLIASVSPRDMNNENNDSLALSVDQALDFSNFQTKDKSPSKNDPVDNFLQTITEFVSSDEFNSDSIGQMSNKAKQKKKSKPISENHQHQSPSPPVKRRIKPKSQHYSNNQEDSLESTLPNDLFTSSSSEYSENVFSENFLKDEFTQSPEQPSKKRSKSLIKLDEEYLIKAALVDEFEHDKRKSKPKQSPNNDQNKNSPNSVKKRKIIIVREYSDADDFDRAKIKYTQNLNPIPNNDDIVYEPPKKSYPRKKMNQHYSESPQKKFTFSDESFSDDEFQENQNNNNNLNNDYNNYNRNNNNDSLNSIPTQNTNNYDYIPNKKVNIGINSSNVNNNINNYNKKTPKSSKNIELSDKNEEESSLHFSSTIEIPQVELNDIAKLSSKKKRNDGADDSSFSNDQNVSVMTMTEGNFAKSKNNNSKSYNSPKNKKISGLHRADSSDEIDFLLKDDDDFVISLPNKNLSNTANKSNPSNNHDDLNSNNFSYNDFSYDDYDF